MASGRGIQRAASRLVLLQSSEAGGGEVEEAGRGGTLNHVEVVGGLAIAAACLGHGGAGLLRVGEVEVIAFHA